LNYKIITSLAFLIILSFKLNAQNIEQHISDAYIRGDDKILFENLDEYIRKNTFTFNSYIYLKSIVGLTESVGHERIIDLLQFISRKNATNLLEYEIIRRAYLYKDDIEYRYRKTEGISFKKIYNPIETWKVSQLYFRFGDGDLNYKFEPEIYGTIVHPDEKRIISKIRNGVIQLYSQSAEKGVVIAETDIHVKTPSIIRIESDDQYIAVVNGERIIENLDGCIKRNERFILLPNAGNYRLLLKVTVQSSGFRVTVENSFWKELNILSEPIVKEIESELVSDDVKKPISPEKYRKLAFFYHDKESIECLNWIAQDKAKDIYTRMLYANMKIFYGYEYSINTLKSNGKKDYWEIYSENKNNITALTLYCEQTKNSEIKQSINMVNPMLSNRQFQIMALSLLAEEDSIDFENRYNKVKLMFPYSTSIDLIKAEYLKYRNPDLAEEICKNVLSYERNFRAQSIIYDLHKQRGDSDVVIKEFEDDLESDLKKATLYMAAGNYTDAKQTLLKNEARMPSYQGNILLGRIESLNDRDNELYFEKARSLSVNDSFPKDYLNYKNSLQITSLTKYVNTSMVSAVFSDYMNDKIFTDDIIFRQYIYEVLEKGGSFLVSEMIYIRDERDVKRYGEYKIPISDNMRLLKAVVYDRKGEISAVNSGRKVDGEYYITLQNLQNDSLVNVMYEVESYNPVLRDSALLDTGKIFVQDYGQKISHVEISVLCHDNSINVYSSPLLLRNESKEGSVKVVSLFAKDLKILIKRKQIPEENILPWFSVNNFRGDDDIIYWLRGQYRKSTVASDSLLVTDSKADKIIIKTIASYDTEERGFENIEQSLNVQYSQKGSIIEKAFLAYSLLTKYGKNPYLGLSVKRGKESEKRLSLEDVEGILIYLQEKDGIGSWIDLNDERMPFGCVSEKYEHTEAIVFNQTQVYRKRVYSRVPQKKTVNLEYVLKESSAKVNGTISLLGSSTIQVNNSNYKKYFNEVQLMIHHNFDTESTGYNYSEDRSEITFSGNIEDFSVKTGASLLFKPFTSLISMIEFDAENNEKSSFTIQHDIITNEKSKFTVDDVYKNSEVNFEKIYEYEGIRIVYKVEKTKNSQIVSTTRDINIPYLIYSADQKVMIQKILLECKKYDKMFIELKSK
jgi:hypothetical protein